MGVVDVDLRRVERRVVLRSPGVRLVVEDEAPSGAGRPQPEAVRAGEVGREVADGDQGVAEAQGHLAPEADDRPLRELHEVAVANRLQRREVDVVGAELLLEEHLDARAARRHEGGLVAGPQRRRPVAGLEVRVAGQAGPRADVRRARGAGPPRQLDELEVGRPVVSAPRQDERSGGFPGRPQSEGQRLRSVRARLVGQGDAAGPRRIVRFVVLALRVLTLRVLTLRVLTLRVLTLHVLAIGIRFGGVRLGGGPGSIRGAVLGGSVLGVPVTRVTGRVGGFLAVGRCVGFLAVGRIGRCFLLGRICGFLHGPGVQHPARGGAHQPEIVVRAGTRIVRIRGQRPDRQRPVTLEPPQPHLRLRGAGPQHQQRAVVRRQGGVVGHAHPPSVQGQLRADQPVRVSIRLSRVRRRGGLRQGVQNDATRGVAESQSRHGVFNRGGNPETRAPESAGLAGGKSPC